MPAYADPGRVTKQGEKVRKPVVVHGAAKKIELVKKGNTTQAHRGSPVAKPSTGHSVGGSWAVAPRPVRRGSPVAFGTTRQSTATLAAKAAAKTAAAVKATPKPKPKPVVQSTPRKGPAATPKPRNTGGGGVTTPVSTDGPAGTVYGTSTPTNDGGGLFGGNLLQIALLAALAVLAVYYLRKRKRG